MSNDIINYEARIEWFRQQAHSASALPSAYVNALCNMALAHLRSQPAGYVSVPEHPTSEMMNQGALEMRELQHKLATTRSNQDIVTRVYKAMLAASPPAGEGAMVIKDDGGFLP